MILTREYYAMAKKLKKVPRLMYILLITAILFSIFSVKSYYTNENANLSDFKPISIIDEAQLTYKGKSSYIEMPIILDVKEPFELEINISGETNLSEKSIGLYIGYSDVDVLVDGKVIYRNEVGKDNYTYSGGYPYRIIKIPRNIVTPLVKIKVKPNLKLVSTYTIRPIEIGKKSNFYTYLMKEDYEGIIVSSILLFIFVISVLIYGISIIIKSKMTRLYNVGLISLFGGVYSLTSYRLMSYLFSTNIEFLYFMEYTSLLLLPYPMIRILESSVDKRGKKILFWIKNIIIINYIAQVIMTVVYVIITYVTNGHYSMYGFIMWGFIFFIIFQIWLAAVSYIKSKNENVKTTMYKKYIYLDIMTGLNSRFAFEEKMKEIKQEPIDVSIISCDLNDLKIVNDNKGHAYGDAMIKKAGEELRSYFKGAYVYRTGGDEYVVISEKIIADSYIENFKRREVFVDVYDEKLPVNISIGKYDCYHNGEFDIYEAFKIADEKMYEDKLTYKNRNNANSM